MSHMSFINKQTSLPVGSQLHIGKYHSSHVLCAKLASLDSFCFQFFNVGTSGHHLQTTPSHCLECGPLETYLDF